MPYLFILLDSFHEIIVSFYVCLCSNICSIIVCLLILNNRSQAAAREATLKATMFDERWSKHRSITDLAWSTKVDKERGRRVECRGAYR